MTWYAGVSEGDPSDPNIHFEAIIELWDRKRRPRKTWVKHKNQFLVDFMGVKLDDVASAATALQAEPHPGLHHPEDTFHPQSESGHQTPAHAHSPGSRPPTPAHNPALNPNPFAPGPHPHPLGASGTDAATMRVSVHWFYIYT
jgi:hypothetical protein